MSAPSLEQCFAAWIGRRGVVSVRAARGRALTPAVLAGLDGLAASGFVATSMRAGPEIAARTAVLVELPKAAAVPASLGLPPRSDAVPPRWLAAELREAKRLPELERALLRSHFLSEAQEARGGALAIFERLPLFPRTPYLHGSAVRSADDRVLDAPQTARLLEGRLEVQEKVDGFNLAVFFRAGELSLCDMEGPVDGDEHRALLDAWAWAALRRPALRRALGERYVLYVEVAHLRHTLRYRRLPDLALGFDVFDREEGAWLDGARARRRVEGCGVGWVPELPLPLGRGAAVDRARVLGPSRLGAPAMEGVVIRRVEGGRVVARGKWVVKGFELAPHPLQWAAPRWNALAAEAVPVRPAPRRWTFPHGRVEVERGGAMRLVREGGARTLEAAARAAALWGARGATGALRSHQRLPAGRAAEVVELEGQGGGPFLPLAAALAHPEALGRLLVALHVPERALTWVWAGFPKGAGAPRALCVGDWSACRVQRVGRGAGARLVLGGAVAPELGEPARDVAALLATCGADLLTSQRVISAWLSTPGAPPAAAAADEVARWLEAPEALAPRPPAADTVAAQLASQVLDLALPSPELLEGVRQVRVRLARLRSRPALPQSPTAAVGRRGARALVLDAGTAQAVLHLRQAWAAAARAADGQERPLPRLVAPPMRSPVAASRPLLEREYVRAVRALGPGQRVLIALPEGALAWARRRWLSKAGVAERALGEVYAAAQVARLEGGPEHMAEVEAQRLAEAGVGWEVRARLDAELPFSLEHQGPLVSARLPGGVTAIDYPWGRDAAFWLARALASAGVRRLAFCGACGLTGREGDVEDVVAPTRVAARGARPLRVGARGLSESLAGAARRAGLGFHAGPIFNVDSALEETDALFARLHGAGYAAVEMELWGLAAGLAGGGVALAPALFVTDALARGKGYFFDPAARAEAYARPVRGRDVCLEVLVAWLQRGGERGTIGSAARRREQ